MMPFKSFFCLIVGLLLIASFGYSEGRREAPAAVVVDDVPQYGGTLTPWVSFRQTGSPPNPAIMKGMYTSLLWRDFVQEMPVVGDVETYGPKPRGSGEYTFQYYYGIPVQYLTGELAESWELSLDRFVYHVRPGIYWAPTEDQMRRGVMKEPRELVAEDFVAYFRRFVTSPWKARFEGIIAGPESIYATDRYTMVIDLEEYNYQLIYYLGYEDRALIGAPETELADPERWENVIGTGPFMFEEYVTDAYMSFVKNPNYWGTTTIDGVEYQLPFVDRLVVPIIPDDSTRMSALATGKLDLYRVVPTAWWDTLERIAPALEELIFSAGLGWGTVPRIDQPPFDDIRVRKAMVAGTDRQPFVKFARAEAMDPLHFAGALPDHPAYTPLKEMPRDVQALYDYNPELAKKLLAEAGYPNGFKTNILVGPEQQERDAAAMLKDQWAKIGVDLTIGALDATTANALRMIAPPSYKPLFDGLYFSFGQVRADPMSTFMDYYRPHSPGNYTVYRNPEFEDIIYRASIEPDTDEQTRLIRQANLMLVEDFVYVALTLVPYKNAWWPWVRNYYGEITLQDDAVMTSLIKHMWVDRNMKRAMGY